MINVNIIDLHEPRYYKTIDGEVILYFNHFDVCHAITNLLLLLHYLIYMNKLLKEICWVKWS